ncbi:hypothetical protein L7F22_030256 [Adiantum nelumboides]|nr:hypothetical protein [Adiantum nelumboides]
MGNCATRSLLTDMVHHSSQTECEEVISSPSSTGLLSKEAHTELRSSHGYLHLKPIMPSSVNDPLLDNVEFIKQSLFSPVESISTFSSQEASAQSPIQSPTKAKVAKKVTFATDLVQTCPSSQPISHEVAMSKGSTTCCRQEAHQHRLSANDIGPQREKHIMEKLSASVQVEEGAVPCNNMMKEKINGATTRVKVVISKKQLSELMSTTSAVLQKEAADAFLQKMVGPLLPQLIAASSPQVKYSAKSDQSWRPSLNCIPEAYSVQEIFT